MKGYNKSKNRNDSLHYSVEEIVFHFDSYKNMEERLKKDNLYFKKHIFDCNL